MIQIKNENKFTHHFIDLDNLLEDGEDIIITVICKGEFFDLDLDKICEFLRTLRKNDGK